MWLEGPKELELKKNLEHTSKEHIHMVKAEPASVVEVFAWTWNNMEETIAVYLSTSYNK